MAKKKSGRRSSGNAQPTPAGENVSAYFRQIFKENPKLLKAPSNDAVYQRWLDDHPGEQEVPTRVKQIVSFVKSTLRKKRRKKRASGETTPPPAATVAPAVESMSSGASTASQDLESLEESIDECLTLAKTLDRESLATVISHLRLARNEIVLKHGP
jgi:hypothetical protein